MALEARISGFTGLDTIHDPRVIGPKALVEAVNVNVGTDGIIKTRPGYISVFPTMVLAAHNNVMLLADNTLRVIPNFVDPMGVVQGSQITSATVGSSLIVSSEITIGEVTQVGFQEFVGRPVVSVSASVTAGTSFTLLVRAVMVDSNGFNSLPSQMVAVQITADDTVQISGDPSYAGMRIYVSAPNGEVLFFHSEVPGTSASLVGLDDSTRLAYPIEREYLEPMPPGDILSEVNGCLVSCYGPYVTVSEPLDFKVYNPISGVFEFPAPVTMLLSLGKTTFVGTENELYSVMGTNPQEWVLTRLVSMGVTRNSGKITRVRLPGDPSDQLCAVFMLKNGTVAAGLDGGFIRNLTETKVIPGPMRINGASILESIYYTTY